MDEEKRLGSWKEIGAYLERDARTVRRWEKEEGLPVHRHSHKARASVYAYPSEIDAWRAGRKVAPEPEPPRPLWKNPAFAVTLALCLVMVGNGIRPQVAAAQQEGQTARLIWSDRWAGGSPSLDGRYVSFTDWDTGNLVMRDLASGVNRLLTGNKSALQGSADHSILSPNGHQVAYRWAARGGFSLRILPVGAAEGEEPKILPWGGDAIYGRPVAWTPDGKRLLVIRQLPDRTWQLAMVSVQDGATRTLKSLEWHQPFRISLSPDGRHIAYDLPADGKAHDIFVLSADGSRETTVVGGPADEHDAVWSPDGSRLVFLSDRTGVYSLWTVPVREGEAAGPAELLKPGVGRFTPLGMTRSGALYYLVGGPRRNIQTAELDTALNAAATPVRVSERFVDNTYRASWSPDGRLLAYYAARANSLRVDRELGPDTLVIRSLKTGAEREVPLPISDDTWAAPRWFPDGGSVLVVVEDSEAAVPGIGYYRVDVATGAAQLLRFTRSTSLHLARSPLLSPDGKTLYYGEDDGLVRYDLESRREIHLGDWMGNEYVRSPALSPDGSQIAYLEFIAGGGTALKVMPSSGGEPRTVLQVKPWAGASTFATLAWTPDGRHLLFFRSESNDDKNTDLYRVLVAGGQPEKVNVSRKSGWLTNPQVHPDGRRIVFSTREAGMNEVWALENFLPGTEAGK